MSDPRSRRGTGAVRGSGFPESPSLTARIGESLFSLGARLYHGGFDRGLRRARRLEVPVLSVGNLTVGGTGKTPVTRALAGAALGRGLRPAILTRGYGGTRKGILRGGRWDGGDAALVAESGDEPLWLSRVLPEVPVVVDPDRARAGAALLEREPVDLYLLDDGFQHRRLVRDRDLVLLDAESPVGNGHALPAGPRREPASGLRRADAVLLTGLAAGEVVPEATHEFLARHAPGTPWSRVTTRPAGLRTLDPGEPEAGDPRDLPVWAISGIAHPLRFRNLLEEIGVNLMGFDEFPDHHPFQAEEIEAVQRRARMAGAIPVTTAKDAVRLEPGLRPGSGWAVLEIHSEVEGGWERFLDGLPEGGR